MFFDRGEAGNDDPPEYLEGFGAVFSVRVDFPLIGPQQAPPPSEPDRKADDSEWERARAELSGSGAGGPDSFRAAPNFLLPGTGEMGGTPAPTFDQSKVETLKRALTRALRNGSNLRGVKPDEWIVVVVTGAPDSDSLAVLQQSAISALKKDPYHGWPGAVPTTWWGAGRSTMMTIGVKKSHAGSIPDDDREPSANEIKSLSINAYYGGRVLTGGLTGVMGGGSAYGPVSPAVK
jgi:hypothetical protein